MSNPDGIRIELTQPPKSQNNTMMANSTLARLIPTSRATSCRARSESLLSPPPPTARFSRQPTGGTRSWLAALSSIETSVAWDFVGNTWLGGRAGRRELRPPGPREDFDRQPPSPSGVMAGGRTHVGLAERGGLTVPSWNARRAHRVRRGLISARPLGSAPSCRAP